MKIHVINCSLSDGSKVWSVCVTDDDLQTAEIPCLDERSALFLYDEMSASIAKYTNYSEEDSEE